MNLPRSHFIKGIAESICHNYKVGQQSITFFKKMGQSRPLFVYFRPFLVKISIQIEKSIDGGVLGIRTWGRRIVGAVSSNYYTQLIYRSEPERLN